MIINSRENYNTWLLFATPHIEFFFTKVRNLTAEQTQCNIKKNLLRQTKKYLDSLFSNRLDFQTTFTLHMSQKSVKSSFTRERIPSKVN